MPSMICHACGRETLYEGARPKFCSHCAGRFPDETESENAVRKRISEALLEEDVQARYRMLLAVREEYPEHPDVELELLSIGRLHERGGKPDFYRIPFWPLSAYEKPKEFSKKMRAEMLKRFFENQELLRVMKLYDDESACIRAYFDRMAEGYVSVFLKSSSENSSFLGFRRRESEIMKRSAASLVRMMETIENADYPDEKTRLILIGALWRAFEKAFPDQGAEEYLAGCAKGRLKFRP